MERHALALRDLVETEVELQTLLIERANHARGRRARRLWQQIGELGSIIDRDIDRLEEAWCYGRSGALEPGG